MDAVVGPEYQVEYSAGSGASKASQSSAPGTSQGAVGLMAKSVSGATGNSEQVPPTLGGSGKQSGTAVAAPHWLLVANAEPHTPGAHSVSSEQGFVQSEQTQLLACPHSASAVHARSQLVLVPEASGLLPQLAMASASAVMTIRFTVLLPVP
jgi:hypothetical protein